jgi:uncharacterized protein
MYFSKHNILSKIAGSNDFILVNILSGNADIINSEEANAIEKGIFPNENEFIEKGYLIDPEEEQKLFRKRYLEFIDNRENDEVQLFFVSEYACNFGCLYCYQDEYVHQNSSFNKEVIDAFYNFIYARFDNRRKYITLFGGEPLLPGDHRKKLINYFIEKSALKEIDVAVVTNGYHLADYLPILKKTQIREIQVTLDGTEEVHNKRRPLKNGHSTFRQIVEGIDLALQENMPVNLRVVVDKQNIGNLPELARFAIDKGWTANPLFKTQLGRNYELHHCQAGNQKLFTRINLYEQLYDLILNHPHILEFHKPAFSISRFLYEEGKLPFPLFDSCPGAKTEWAFDHTGKIFACTATVGKSGEELGTYHPHISMDETKISEWEDRDILSIPACKDCPVQLACGGGCAAVAKNKSGHIHSPDCRPVRELIGLGTGLYFNSYSNVY